MMFKMINEKSGMKSSDILGRAIYVQMQKI